MAKRKTFKLKHHEPFEIEGELGTYEIPPLEKMAYDDWKDVAALLNGDADMGNMLEAYKSFFLNVCPDIANEEIGDNQWLQLGSAYFESMGE